jgi:quercetin dioxygenase-like cupin family protein
VKQASDILESGAMEAAGFAPAPSQAVKDALKAINLSVAGDSETQRTQLPAGRRADGRAVRCSAESGSRAGELITMLNTKTAFALFCASSAALLCLAAPAPGAFAGQPPTAPPAASPAAAVKTGDADFESVPELIIAGRAVMRLRSRAGGLTPLERAYSLRQRLGPILTLPNLTAEDVTVEQDRPGQTAFIYVRRRLLITVDRNLALANNTSVEGLAATWARNLRNALPQVNVTVRMSDELPAPLPELPPVPPQRSRRNRRHHGGTRDVPRSIFSPSAARRPVSGPQWSRETDDLDMTLLSWRRGKTIAAHVNREVDVLVVAIEGEGDVTVDGAVHRLRAGQALLIPKGAERGFAATAASFGYLSIHKRRGGLQITPRSTPLLPR